MKVVVTGGAGFIGSNLGRELLTRSDVDEVVALDDLSTGFRANLDGTGIRLLEGTILDPDALDAACEGADAVVHLAALPSVPRSVLDPVASHHANATGTLEVLQAARRAGDLLGHRPAVDHVEQRAGDVRDSQADHTRLRAHFTDVKPVPLREGLEQTVDWFRTLPEYRA
mgnify:CR=1 FL=1